MVPQFEVFGRQIGSYGVLAVIGLFFCGAVGIRLAKQYQIAYEDIILSIAFIGIGLLVGGHLVYGLTNISDVILILKNLPKLGLSDAFSLLVNRFGGMVFYGGFLGGVVALSLFAKHSKTLNKGTIFDIYAVTIPLFHFFGRIGCFFAGCCYGIESHVGFIVYDNEIQPEINGVVRFPVQLLEAACNLLIFVVLYIMFRKRKMQNRLIYCYLLIYPVVRFTDEFLRGDEIRGFWLHLSTSQWISCILFLFAVISLLRGNRKGAEKGRKGGFRGQENE